MRLRSGLMLQPSLGERFLDVWTYSLGVIHASHSALPENDLEPTTLGTSGPLSQTEFPFSAPDSASSRTSKDTFPWGCPTSCETWEDWVIERRGDYLARLKSVPRTNGKEFLSSVNWPSPVASEVRQGFQDRSRGKKGSQESLTTAVIKISGRFGPTSPNPHGNPQGSPVNLNPRWVELLMGLPVGWTMPSCVDPVTIELTNSDSSETE